MAFDSPAAPPDALRSVYRPRRSQRNYIPILTPEWGQPDSDWTRFSTGSSCGSFVERHRDLKRNLDVKISYGYLEAQKNPPSITSSGIELTLSTQVAHCGRTQKTRLVVRGKAVQLVAYCGRRSVAV